jgi:hypothetical protein
MQVKLLNKASGFELLDSKYTLESLFLTLHRSLSHNLTVSLSKNEKKNVGHKQVLPFPKG